jgi:hypothetical protein
MHARYPHLLATAPPEFSLEDRFPCSPILQEP